ncbi:ABC transporter substrate-binding protein [Comamonas endophytica]|uniref:Thiamine pyrimidine synthase n=1 Tax=Comamonas endophytica TaxID=2949090 RepID=A0ABY6G8V7_9BURK|nr:MULTISPECIES: ABC transporter substrate-binding protein [unclassified Acidovorax]MCD2514210.1 ABC transporter substrate-binding protein [Acidovorax sp. D4N7]UYG51348.1 ABC transporter substrate-binding protein [Acidovorax sp. 5MLIR]
MTELPMFLSRRGLLGGIAGLALAGPGIAAPAPAGRVRLAGWSKPISEITNILAEPDKGFFRAQGVELDYLPGAGGGDAVRNLLSGQADVAFTDPGSFFMALDKGAKLVAIYDIYPQNVFNVVSLKSSGIRKPADLKGRKIGVYSLSSGTRQNLLVLLHQAGLKESDVQIVVTGLLNFAPLMQGQVDATAATDTGLAVGLRKGIGQVNVMPVREHLNMSSDLFVVREEALREKRALFKAFLKGYRDSAAWMMAHPQEAADLAARRAIDGTQRDINLEVIRLRNVASLPEGKDAASRLGNFDLVALQKGADAYQALGLVQRRIKVSDVVDTSLLPGA